MPEHQHDEDPVMTLGANLEQDRLTRRERRLRAVIAVLQRQAGGAGATAHAGNRHILQAIAEFEAEVGAINARLSDLALGATPEQRRNGVPRDWTTT